MWSYNCGRRHPNTCKFQKQYGRCKYTDYCKFVHYKPTDVLENSVKIEVLETHMKKFKKEMEKKIETFKTQFNNLIKVVEEKEIVWKLNLQLMII